MLIHDLTPAECREVLGRADLARLACSRAGQPYVVPVSIAYDRESDCLLGFSSVGRKVEWMRENPHVCVEVEDVGDRFHWTTLVIFGRYEEVADSGEGVAVRQRALELFEQRPEWWLPAAGKPTTNERPAVLIYRIHIDTVTGRRASRRR